MMPRNLTTVRIGGGVRSNRKFARGKGYIHCGCKTTVTSRQASESQFLYQKGKWYLPHRVVEKAKHLTSSAALCIITSPILGSVCQCFQRAKYRSELLSNCSKIQRKSRGILGKTEQREKEAHNWEKSRCSPRTKMHSDQVTEDPSSHIQTFSGGDLPAYSARSMHPRQPQGQC